jgi:hypothetical protein
MSKKMTPRSAKTKSRARQSGVKNPLVRESLSCENQHVRRLADVFNIADVHSRRAMLGIAASFAGTVGADVTKELGNLNPSLVVADPIRQSVPRPIAGSALSTAAIRAIAVKAARLAEVCPAAATVAEGIIDDLLADYDPRPKLGA